MRRAVAFQCLVFSVVIALVGASCTDRSREEQDLQTTVEALQTQVASQPTPFPTEPLRPTSAPSPQPEIAALMSPTAGKIAYASSIGSLDVDTPGISVINVINADGTGLTRLTSEMENGAFPTWSPDGRQIAFISVKDSNVGIYVINADGSGLKYLTETHGHAEPRPLSWSPDGQQIAFSDYGDWGIDSNESIYVINADGSDPTWLIDEGPGGISPTWSPVGKRIAFTCWYGDNTDICVINADGTGLTRLTDNPANDLFPVWSPDGQSIAFVCWRGDRGKDNADICAINADGTGLIRLTNDPAEDSSPAWAPDGRQIIFQSKTDEKGWHPFLHYNIDIYVINADGTGLTRLTDDPANDVSPAWSPRLDSQ